MNKVSLEKKENGDLLNCKKATEIVFAVISQYTLSQLYRWMNTAIDYTGMNQARLRQESLASLVVTYERFVTVKEISVAATDGVGTKDSSEMLKFS